MLIYYIIYIYNIQSSAANCFSTGPNQFKTSNDYISRKKAQTIYKSVKDNVKANNYAGPILTNGTCLGAVGGYNTDNYDLLLNVTKGKYYTEPQCINITEYPDTPLKQELCTAQIKKIDQKFNAKIN